MAALLGDCMLLRFHAKARYIDLKTGAKTVALYAEEWLKEGHSPTELSGEGCIAAKDGGFGAYLAEKDSGYLRQGDHYAVVCDAQGKIEYVLYSRSRIADRYLKAEPETDMFTAVQTLRIPVFWRFTVVCYP